MPNFFPSMAVVVHVYSSLSHKLVILVLHCWFNKHIIRATCSSSHKWQRYKGICFKEPPKTSPSFDHSHCKTSPSFEKVQREQNSNWEDHGGQNNPRSIKRKTSTPTKEEGTAWETRKPEHQVGRFRWFRRSAFSWESGGSCSAKSGFWWGGNKEGASLPH